MPKIKGLGTIFKVVEVLFIKIQTSLLYIKYAFETNVCFEVLGFYL